MKKTLPKVIFTVLLLVLLAYQVDLKTLAQTMVSVQLVILLPAVLLQVLMALVSTIRWRAILSNFAIQTGLSRLARLVFIGAFFNLFLPSSIGGDVIRAFYLSRQTGRGMSTTLMTTVLERSAGLCALLAIGSAAVFTQNISVHGVPLSRVFALLLLFYAAANLILFNSKAHGILTRFLGRFKMQDVEAKMELVYKGLKSLIRNRRSIVVALGLSLGIQFSSVLIVWIAGKSLGIQSDFLNFLVFIPLINLSIMVPLTINGFGLRESLYFLLFTQIGLSEEQSVALSLLNTLVVMAAALPGGLFYSLYKREPGFDEALRQAETGRAV